MEAVIKCSICNSDRHDERTCPDRKNEEITNYQNEDFINIACDEEFINKVLVKKFIVNDLRYGNIKENYEEIYFDSHYDHEIYYTTSSPLYHVIITNMKNNYWKYCEDKLKDNYNLLTRGNIVMAISKEKMLIKNTLYKRDTLEILKDKYSKKNRRYRISTPFDYSFI